MYKDELIKSLEECSGENLGEDLLNNIKTLISYVSDNKGKWDLIKFWDGIPIIDPIAAEVWGEIKKLLYNYEGIKTEEKKEKIIKDVERYLENKTPLTERKLKGIANQLGYELKEGKEGTSCVLNKIVITRIPGHKGDFAIGTSTSILRALRDRKPNIKLRGQEIKQ